MQSDSRLTWPFRQSRMSLGLSSLEQRRFRLLIAIRPFDGRLVYPTMTVRGKNPQAGVYENDLEARNVHGFPQMLTLQWLVVNENAPVWGIALALTVQARVALALSIADMEAYERLAQSLVQAGTSDD